MEALLGGKLGWLQKSSNKHLTLPSKKHFLQLSSIKQSKLSSSLKFLAAGLCIKWMSIMSFGQEIFLKIYISNNHEDLFIQNFLNKFVNSKWKCMVKASTTSVRFVKSSRSVQPSKWKDRSDQPNYLLDRIFCIPDLPKTPGDQTGPAQVFNKKMT